MNEEEFNKLINELMSFALKTARNYVEDKGGFTPFAVALKADGKYTFVQAATDGNEGVNQVIDALKKLKYEEELLGAAICMDTLVTIADQSVKQDCIKLVLEDLRNPTMNGYQVYRKRGNGYEFDQLEAEEGESLVSF